MDPRFTDDSVIRRVDAEGALLLGGGRALLLQLAHPGVAAGVADHSDFEHDPMRRLFGTLEATYTIVFGTAAEAERIAGGIRHGHDRVNGPGYDAHDPELLCWVNATLIDTAVRVYEAVVQPLSDSEKDSYYLDSRYIAEVLGCPLEAQPADWIAFEAYMAKSVAGLEVGDTARKVARAVLHPTALPAVTKPAMALSRFLTAGTLPPEIRDQYGLAWDDRKARALHVSTRAAASAHRLFPQAVRHLPKNVLLRRVRRRSAATPTRPATSTAQAWSGKRTTGRRVDQ